MRCSSIERFIITRTPVYYVNYGYYKTQTTNSISGLNITEGYAVISLCMSSFRLHNRILKCCALVAATLVLPALAYADRDHDKDRDQDKGSSRDSDEHRGDDRDRDCHIPIVPEANAGWVLIPFVGAVLLFSWRRFSRAKT
jgi:hypothetical protein